VQEILNQNGGGHHYFESPNTLRKEYMQHDDPTQFFENEIKFPSVPLNDNLNFLHQPISNHQSPVIRKSILKQTSTNYENFNYKSPNSSPLLNTQLPRHDFSNNGRASSLSIPSSPLKVNVNDIKWSNLKTNNNLLQNINNIITEAPSSQLSSDSGYSGQTAIQMMNGKINSLNSSPTINETNDNYLPAYEYQIKFKTNLFVVQVVKNPGLGFSISGGKGSVGNPFKPNDPGIFVTKVHPEGPAANLLKPGDQIMKVNGEDYTNIEHEKAVAILKSCNKIANLLIKRSF
jgi:hypothetical protein